MGVTTCQVERDSVCMGDDVDAPHASTFHVEATTGDTALDCIRTVLANQYLPGVAGGSTWIAYSGAEALAVVALDRDGRSTVWPVEAPPIDAGAPLAIRFAYFHANCAERILADLKAGRVLALIWEECA